MGNTFFFLRRTLLLRGLATAASILLPMPFVKNSSVEEELCLAGTWDLTVSFPDGHSEQSQVVFNRNGVVINVTPFPGKGEWRTKEKTAFSYSFVEPITPHGQFQAVVEVRQNARLSIDCNSYTASGTGTVYDAQGNRITQMHTTTVATKVA